MTLFIVYLIVASVYLYKAYKGKGTQSEMKSIFIGLVIISIICFIFLVLAGIFFFINNRQKTMRNEDEDDIIIHQQVVKNDLSNKYDYTKEEINNLINRTGYRNNKETTIVKDVLVDDGVNIEEKETILRFFPSK